MEIIKNHKKHIQNHPFSGRVLGLKNASFWNPLEENDPFILALAGKFFLQLRNAKYHVVSKKKHIENFATRAEGPRRSTHLKLELVIWSVPE